MGVRVVVDSGVFVEVVVDTGVLVMELEKDAPKDCVAEGEDVSDAVGEGSVYVHHRPAAHEAVLHWATATKYTVWLVTAMVTCASPPHTTGTLPPSSLDATQPQLTGSPVAG